MTKTSLNIPQLIKSFFSEYLLQQRGCSPNTIGAYSDTFRLFLKYRIKARKIRSSQITLEDFSAKNIMDFLNYLEKVRKNGPGTRNSRLAAIRSFLNYLLIVNPTLAGDIQGALLIPQKRKQRVVLDYLTRYEIDSIIDSVPQNTWSGRRDRILFQLMYNTGARVSEIIDLKVSDIKTESKGTIHIFGKGRKERNMPLWKNTTLMLRHWIKSNCYTTDMPLFPNNRGQKMTRSGVNKRLADAVAKASTICQTLKEHRISPHTIRHTSAMHLLQGGMDITVIAMWLGHESIETTHTYISADMEMKTKLLNSLQEPSRKCPRFKPSDSLLEFLENL